MRLVWTDQALFELEELLAYIAAESPKNAALVGRRLYQSAANIAEMP